MRGMEMKELIRLEKINKSFSGVQALSDVNINLYEGEVHVLLGENVAGKSTLMKVLTGIYQPDSGEIFIDGNKVKLRGPKEAEDLGINIIHQEFNLLLHQDVATNIFLGKEPLKKGKIIDFDKLHEKSRKVLEDLEVNINTHELVLNLGVGERQIVEIAKAVSQNAKVIIMDEPTAALTANEIDKLFKMVDKLIKRGVGIFYISHRMEEIYKIGKRISVLRDGRHISTMDLEETTIDKLVQLMVGREIGNFYFRQAPQPGEEVLRFEGIQSGKKVKNGTISLKKGEIVGVFGLMGAGRTEMAQAAYGVMPRQSGKVILHGKELKGHSPMECVSSGLGLVPEDRKYEGATVDMTIRENVVQASLKRIHPSNILNIAKEKEITKSFIDKLRIATPSTEKEVGFLSGGTQQKVILAKWLCAQP
jgi:ribose transport system ATP-binding protein